MIKRLFLNDKFILLLILLNAVIIFLSGFDLGYKRNLLLALIDNAFTIIFITELLIKIKEFGKSFFSSGWNKFDMFLVLLSVPTLIFFLIGFDANSHGFFMVFRVLRVFKSFRFLKFVPGIDHLIKGVKRALKASLIVIIGFAVYIFIIGIFSFYLFKDVSPENFKNPLIALYSTFKIFTIEGWFDIPDEVTGKLSPIATFFTYIYFIFIVLSGGIFGLSLVNSIFVDAMVSDNNEEVDKKLVRLEYKLDQILKLQKNDSAGNE